MRTFFQKNTLLLIAVFGLMALPLKAQQIEDDSSDQAFIEQGTFLTGFSVGFTNASTESFNHEFAREISKLLIDIDGLYFVSDHFGFGPLLGYEFVYRDLVPSSVSAPGDIDTRSGQFKFGAKAGWYTSANELFGWSSGNALFFIDAGVNWLRYRYQSEGLGFDVEADYDFGYQIGTGFLFPVGDQIAIETKLGFQSRREDYRWGVEDTDGQVTWYSQTKWLEDVTLSVGFKVAL